MQLDYSSREQDSGDCRWFVHEWKPQQRNQHPLKILALHGFLGSGEDFAAVAKQVEIPIHWICPDLPGHGNSPWLDQNSATSKDIIGALHSFITEWGPFDQFLGYSMGGRLLLELFAQKTLLGCPVHFFSVNPGLRSDEMRTLRLKTDNEWAKLLTEDPEQFWQKWNLQPLFKKNEDTSSFPFQAGSIKGLAKCLEILSPAVLSSHWPLLSSIDKAHYYVGEEDKKYMEIASEISQLAPNWKVASVPKAAHRLLKDNPTAIANSLSAGILLHSS